MSLNSLGHVFRFTTWGESHGPAIGAVVDGCPPGLALSEADIQPFLDKRRPGTSRFTTQRQEPDQVRILSGVFEGKTTGTPISLMIENVDQRSKDYSEVAQAYRPGHADYAYDAKYGFRDYRGGGRSSARETAVRVAAGAIAKKWLKERYGVVIRGCMSQMGNIDIPFVSWDVVGQNAFFSPNLGIVQQLENYLDAIRAQRDSVGAKITVVAENVPVGWGEPVYDRLDAELAYAMMGINAAKGVEIGAGFASVAQKGSEHCDEMTPQGFASNNAGGILGGISTGQDIVVHTAFKPTSSLPQERRSIDAAGNAVMMQTTGRHDPCVGVRATPICEAMLALVLIDHALRHRAQCGDVVSGIPRVPGSIK
jgi:chorismate synthase